MTSTFRRPGPLPAMAAALVMAAAALFEAGWGGERAELSPLSVTSALLTGVSLLAAYFSPAGGVALLAATVGVPGLFVDDLPPSGGAQLIASIVLVGYAGYRLSARGALIAYLLLAFVPAVTIISLGESVWELLFYALILAPAWVVGVLLRREQVRSAELARLAAELRAERERQAEVAVAAERTRISRELHDAVAHTVSVMTLQVGIARRRLGGDSVEGELLQGAEKLGRQAVDELRRIVGLVREGEHAALAPIPSLTQLDELVDQVRAAGAEVRVHVDGRLEEVPQAVGISAYRIIQEALTNVLRHAPGAACDVTVVLAADELRVSVTNGRATRTLLTDGTPGGHGLTGIRERVHVLGGRFESGPVPGGGFAVRVELPLPESEKVDA